MGMRLIEQDQGSKGKGSVCVLVILHRSVLDYPIVVAGNREEAYARQGEEPQLLNEAPRIWGGRDPRAGGTWLALNEHGVVVGLTNRRECPYATSQVRSRGVLVLDLAHSISAAEATERCIQQLNHDRYNGFNVLCADVREVWKIQHKGRHTRYERLMGPLHVVTNGDVDDRSEPRIERAWQILSPIMERGPEEFIRVIQGMLADRGTGSDDPAAMCLYGEQGGTLSSTILAVADPIEGTRCWHAQGPPAETPYTDYSRLFSEGRSFK